jgi:glycosyltransferase involved in cell wall biosynthesis
LHQLDILSPDVIITTTNGEVALLNSLRAGIPLVIESHGGFDHVIDYEQDTWIHRIDIRRRYKEISRADAIICLTNTDAARWIGQGFKNVHVISNIANLNPTDMLSDYNEKQALFVGRFSIQKGIQELLAIWEIVHQRYPDWTLEMYGENYEQYKDSVGEGFCLHAPTSSIFSKYCESSMLLLTSRWEPFGLVIPEAMSCGVPVVAFDCPYGPSTIIANGKDGFLIDCYDVEAFANQLCLLMENEALRKEMGQNAILSAKRFTKDKIIPLWINLFESLIV